MGRRPGWSGEVVGLLRNLAGEQAARRGPGKLADGHSAGIQHRGKRATTGRRHSGGRATADGDAIASSRRGRAAGLNRSRWPGWKHWTRRPERHQDPSVIREAVSAIEARSVTALDARLDAGSSRRPTACRPDSASRHSNYFSWPDGGNFHRKLSRPAICPPRRENRASIAQSAPPGHWARPC